MKALVWRENLNVEEAPSPPPPPPGWATVKVRCAGICGSDLTITAGKHPRAKPPLIPGHEFMGIVAALNSADAASGPAPGSRVVVEPLLACGQCRPCRNGFEHVCEKLRLLGVETDGGFAEFVNAPLNRIYPLPPGIPDEDAAMIEPLAVAVHAATFAPARRDDIIAVLGAGPIGLLIAQVCRASGTENIFIFERAPFRLRLAEQLGFRTVNTAERDPAAALRELTGGRLADITFEAAGADATVAMMIPMTAVKGRIVMVALPKHACAAEFRDLAYREQTIFGVRIYAKGNFATAIRLLAEGRVKLRPLVSGVFDMLEHAQAFAMARDADNACKVLLKIS